MKNKTEVGFWKNMSGRKKRGLKYLLMTVPFIVFFIMFSYVPLFGWYLAFTDYKVGQPFWQAEIVGLKHFIKAFHDSDLLRSLRNTLVMSGLNLLTSPLSIVLAIMLNDIRGRKTKKIVQTVTTLPHFISWIVAYGVAFAIFSSNGLWNQILKALNLSTPPAGLIGDSDHVWGFMLMLDLWKGLGWSTIVYLAAIAGIDAELYDAAKVDGANKFQLIWNITVPGVMPTYVVLLLLSVGSMLSVGFEKYYMFWNTFTADKIEVLDYYIWKLGIRGGQYSYSIALSVAKMVVGVILLMFVNWVAKKVRGDSIV